MTTYNYDGIVIVALSGALRTQLTTYFGIDDADLEIGRSFQPTAQYAGAAGGAKKYQIFINPVTPTASIGGGFDDEYNETSGYTERTYRTIRPVIYQFNFLANYDPSDNDSLEAMDLAQTVREMFTQLDFIEELTEINIFPEKPTDVRPSFSVTNEHQNESTPSFDLTLTYNSTYTKDRSRVVSIDGNLKRV